MISQTQTIRPYIINYITAVSYNRAYNSNFCMWMLCAILTENWYFQFGQKCSGKWIITITHHTVSHFYVGVGKLPRAVHSHCMLCLHVSPAFPKSRRQKWETVEKYDQRLPVMCAWNPRRLSKLLARKRRPGNHGNGRSSHAEGGSEPARWGSYWFFDGHRRGFMRKTVTRPLCCADRTGRAWECPLHCDDGDDTYDHVC